MSKELNTGVGTQGSVGSHVPRERMDTVAVSSNLTTPGTSAFALVNALREFAYQVEHDLAVPDYLRGMAEVGVAKADKWLEEVK